METLDTGYRLYDTTTGQQLTVVNILGDTEGGVEIGRTVHVERQDGSVTAIMEPIGTEDSDQALQIGKRGDMSRRYWTS